jgi:hypothetical protein
MAGWRHRNTANARRASQTARHCPKADLVHPAENPNPLWHLMPPAAFPSSSGTDSPSLHLSSRSNRAANSGKMNQSMVAPGRASTVRRSYVQTGYVFTVKFEFFGTGDRSGAGTVFRRDRGTIVPVDTSERLTTENTERHEGARKFEHVGTSRHDQPHHRPGSSRRVSSDPPPGTLVEISVHLRDAPSAPC